ncbi:MAG: two-component system regulatory protein YycI [Anaerovoracaceae bacterium]
MDWSKAKNIILIGLVFTNIFLLLQYVVQYRHLMHESDAISDYTINILSKNNIEVDCKIPSEIPKLSPLTVSYSDLSQSEQQKLIENADTVKPENRNMKGYSKAANKLLSDNGLMDDGTSVERVTESGDNFIVEYGNYYSNIPLEESKMFLTYEAGKLTDITRHWILPAEEGERKIDVISPLSALLGLMSSLDTNRKTVIEEIKLVYYVTPYDSDRGILYDTAFPAWAIKYNGGQIKYISTIEL